jgi:methylated-DNA-[protein]-cysteine S-methyltransferase
MTHATAVVLEHAVVDSPVGRLHVIAREGVLCAISFGDDLGFVERRFGRVEYVEAADPAGAAGALRRYFGGDVHALDGVDAEPGGTPFQSRVWRALRTIPTGETISYAELARRIGSPSAVRAVGAANGANPVPLVIPCHRVIGSNSRLVGYGGGLERKAWLLRHEGVATELPLAVGP